MGSRDAAVRHRSRIIAHVGDGGKDGPTSEWRLRRQRRSPKKFRPCGQSGRGMPRPYPLLTAPCPHGAVLGDAERRLTPGTGSGSVAPVRARPSL
jgi:hypothetical protein